MKITKRQLRSIIKEERAKLISEGPSGTSIKDDIMDAIQMLESEEDPNGALFHVINRLYTALDKIPGVDDNRPQPSGVQGDIMTREDR